MTSELRKIKDSQDLTFRYLLAQHKLSQETVKHQILIHLQCSQEAPIWIPNQWVSTWLHIRITREAFKTHHVPRPISSRRWRPESVGVTLSQVILVQPGRTPLRHPFRRAVVAKPREWNSHLDSFISFSIPPEKGIFRKRHSCASSKDVVCSLGSAGSQRLSGALVVKKKVLVLAEEAEFQASAAASRNKECPGAHEHQDYKCRHQVYSIIRTYEGLG